MTQSTLVNLDGISALPGSSSGAGQMYCLFSSTKSMKIGSGMTSRRHKSTVYWFIRQIRDSAYGIRSVDGNLLPMGKETVISRDKLFEHYTPEAAMFESKMIPSVRQTRYHLDDTMFPGYSSTGPRLRIHKENVRAMFDLGLDYLNRGDTDKGVALINDLLRLETPFSGKDQFLFNSFGIALRKAGQPDLAARCYREALIYTASDDHLYYNLARAHYDGGRWWDCMEALGKCFEYNPELTVSRWLVELIVALAESPELRKRYAKPPVPDGVARRAGVLAEAVSLTPMDKPPRRVRMGQRTNAMRLPLDSDVVWNKDERRMSEVVR